MIRIPPLSDTNYVAAFLAEANRLVQCDARFDILNRACFRIRRDGSTQRDSLVPDAELKFPKANRGCKSLAYAILGVSQVMRERGDEGEGIVARVLEETKIRLTSRLGELGDRLGEKLQSVVGENRRTVGELVGFWADFCYSDDFVAPPPRAGEAGLERFLEENPSLVAQTVISPSTVARTLLALRAVRERDVRVAEERAQLDLFLRGNPQFLPVLQQNPYWAARAQQDPLAVKRQLEAASRDEAAHARRAAADERSRLALRAAPALLAMLERAACLPDLGGAPAELESRLAAAAAAVEARTRAAATKRAREEEELSPEKRVRRLAKRSTLPGVPPCENVVVRCGDLSGRMRVSDDGTVSITYTARGGATETVTGGEFEAAAGRENTKNWKQSIRVADGDTETALLTWARRAASPPSSSVVEEAPPSSPVVEEAPAERAVPAQLAAQHGVMRRMGAFWRALSKDEKDGVWARLVAWNAEHPSKTYGNPFTFWGAQCGGRERALREIAGVAS